MTERVIESLVATGKASFELAVLHAEEYLPKIALQYEDRGGWDAIVFAGPMLDLSKALTVLAEKPITWIALTIDSYQALEITYAVANGATTVTLPYERDGVAINWLEQREKINGLGPAARLLRDIVQMSQGG